MPHQCTSCGTVFADGSTEMLSGCPECAGNTFQYHPGGTDPPAEPASDAEPPKRPEGDDSVARTVGNAAQTVKNFIGRDEPTPGVDPETADPLSPWPRDDATAGDPTASERPGTPESPAHGTTGDDVSADTATETGHGEQVTTDEFEGEAQASARSTVVSPEELSAATGAANVAVGARGGNPATGTASGESADDQSTTEDRPDLSELREELNDQFESIKIVEPGQYELNLMELYEREEYIIALQEDGRYQIQVPETWQD